MYAYIDKRIFFLTGHRIGTGQESFLWDRFFFSSVTGLGRDRSQFFTRVTLLYLCQAETCCIFSLSVYQSCCGRRFAKFEL